MYLIDKLDNGIKVVMEKIDYVNSVSIGVIINNGSIREEKCNNGVSHFIEHMLFKGTKNRNPREIAESIDNIGGQLNAFTGKEQTCYYAKVLDQHLPIAIDVLGDMINNSLFLEEDIEKEKSVIIEEINMYLDEPEDLVYELLNEIMFENTTLEYPILGIESIVSSMTRETIIDYFYNNYIPENMIVSLAGNFDPKETLKLLNQAFGYFNNKDSNPQWVDNNQYNYTNKIKGIHRKTEQLNFCIGLEGVNSKSDDIHSTLVMNNIFGGSMSSRLFQSIREDRGLAYSVYSHLSTFENTGVFSIYAGLNPKQITKVTKLIKDEIINIKNYFISKDELYRSKEQLKGNYILGTEGTFSRMFENGKSLSLTNRIECPEEIINKINKVNLDDIKRVVENIFIESKTNIAYVGHLKNQEKIENEIKEILFS